MNKIISNSIEGLRKSMKNYWTTYRTDQIIKIVSKGKYDKVISKLNDINKYRQIKINDYGFIYYVISMQNTELLEKLLLTKYRDDIICDIDNPLGLTPMNFALLNEQYEVAEILQKFGAQQFMPTNDNNTIVHLAAQYNNDKAIQFAISNKIDINLKNSNDDTALHIAVVQENLNIVNLLLQNKAKVAVLNKHYFSPIHESVQCENIEIFKLLLKYLSEVRNIPNSKFDPIHIASQQESKEALQILINQNPVLVNLQDNNQSKSYPLHYACLSKSIACAELLLKNNVNQYNIKAKINAQDKNLNTAIHIAVYQKDIIMCQLLTQYNADATIKNEDNLSAIDLCFTEKDRSLLNYFKSQPKYARYFSMEDDD